MATNITKLPIFRTVAVRGYATASGQPVPIGGVTDYEIKNTTLPSNVTVASAENGSPISRVSVVFRAGSRNETPENTGVAHTLRICAGLSTKNASQFAITRQIQQVGAVLKASSDREVVAYTLEGTRDAVEKTLPLLKEVATQQVFKPWEVADSVPRQRLELALRPPQLRAVDLLHKAAFRRGLGNSLYSPKYLLGKISSETLQHYVATNCTAGRAAVVGLGVDHHELVQYATSLGLSDGEGTTQASPYKGGELRSDKGGDYAFVAIGGEGGALKNLDEALAFAILQRALGVGPQIPYGTQGAGALSKAFNADLPAAVSAINASYSDSGLFGVLIAAPADNAGEIVQKVAKVLKGGNLSDADITRGKTQLKTSLLLSHESGDKAIEDIGVQAALLGSATTANAVACQIDAIKPQAVKNALAKVAKKLSMAAYGNLKTVPFLDELKASNTKC